MSVNKVILLGRLGRDPELRYTPNGSAVCNLNIATSESWKDKNTGDKQERTEWHRVVVWGKSAEHCNQYLSKGKQVYVEGRLQTRSWDDNAGVKKYTTEIMANAVQFLGQAGSPVPNSDTNNFRPPQSSDPMGGSSNQSTPQGGGSDNQGSSNTSSFQPQEEQFSADDIPF